MDININDKKEADNKLICVCGGDLEKMDVNDAYGTTGNVDSMKDAIYIIV